MMDCDRLDYIKSVTDKGDEREWAYPAEYIGSEFKLNFKRSKGVESHAWKLPKGSLIILSQVPHECKNNTTVEQKKIPGGCKKRYLTHVVELVNEGSEDEPKWGEGMWDVFRCVKVHWIADLKNWNSIPVDKEVIRAKWGCYNTCAKSLSSPKLMSEWGTIDRLRERLIEQLNLKAIE
ncbi:hypothetical protein [Nostoc sp.]|uniref:hypothetical protein n=1 Tax=Nostoc sp. TaxID=1180 RepID=UPI002FFB2F6E